MRFADLIKKTSGKDRSRATSQNANGFDLMAMFASSATANGQGCFNDDILVVPPKSTEPSHHKFHRPNSENGLPLHFLQHTSGLQ